MDGWLKMLIAAACIVVIAGGGYLGWREWQASVRLQQAREAAAAAIERQTERLRDEARQAAAEARREEQRRQNAIPDLERRSCHHQLTSLRVAKAQSTQFVEHYQEQVRRCISAGYLTAANAEGLL